MNLNFYQPDNNNYLESLRNTLTDQINKLDQLKNINTNTLQQNINTQTNQPQRYYLDCGIKEDWQEFLKLNYGITETQIFEDYKLFLQAKAELHEDKNKEKLEIMKNKLSKNNKVKQYATDNTNVSNQSNNKHNQQSMENNKNSNKQKGV